MQKRHLDKFQYFKEQAYTTNKYVIPYIEKHLELKESSTILEIGCGEGGNLLPFMDLRCKITGIDLSAGKIDKGKEFYKSHENRKNLTLVSDDIYNRKDLGIFDIIILRDVIEHIPKQSYFMNYLKYFIHKNSIVYFGFPPWQNPFGGHQQICTSKILSKLPYFHILPISVYKGVLSLFGETQSKIKALVEIKETGISIERFEKILRQHNYKIKNRTIFFTNPNYEIKFAIKPRVQNKLIASVPWLRNFFSTAAYYLISTNED